VDHRPRSAFASGGETPSPNPPTASCEVTSKLSCISLPLEHLFVLASCRILILDQLRVALSKSLAAPPPSRWTLLSFRLLFPFWTRYTSTHYPLLDTRGAKSKGREDSSFVRGDLGRCGGELDVDDRLQQRRRWVGKRNFLTEGAREARHVLEGRRRKVGRVEAGKRSDSALASSLVSSAYLPSPFAFVILGRNPKDNAASSPSPANFTLASSKFFSLPSPSGASSSLSPDFPLYFIHGYVLSDTTGVVTGTHSTDLSAKSITPPLSLDDYREKALADLIHKAKQSGAGGVIDVKYRIEVVANGVGALAMADLARN
jgi:uncharacterized protein YbjQ (UPF0145 family)